MLCINDAYKGVYQCVFCVLFMQENEWSSIAVCMPVLVCRCLPVAMGVSSVSPSSGGLQFPIRIIDTPSVLINHSSLSPEAQFVSKEEK